MERSSWIGLLNAWYFLGVDGISMPLIVLTTFITPLVVISARRIIEVKPTQYLAAFLIM
ncbi:MAG: NADH-quinone oxidoreductase subunit M, partial [Steroidobacteraceae bacterium]